MKKNKGISLIVLVITIIVMIILAGSIILSLSNNGIIGKANEAVDASNFKQLQQYISVELIANGWYEGKPITINNLQLIQQKNKDIKVIELKSAEQDVPDTWIVEKDGTKLTIYSTGEMVKGEVELWDGTSSAPEIKDGNWYIYTPSQFKFFADVVNGENTTAGYTIGDNTTVYLMNDLDLGARQIDGELKCGTEWTPIGKTGELKFTGTFEGNNHVIRGVYISSDSPYGVGIFGNSDTIQNLTVKDSYIEASQRYVGGIVGYIKEGELVNCHNVNTEVNGLYCVGGVVGISDSVTIKKCSNTGDVNGEKGKEDEIANTGGIVGVTYVDTVVEDCYNYGEVFAVGRNIGGIVGVSWKNTIVKNCKNMGHVSGNITTVGGIVGQAGTGGVITGNINSGRINGPWHVGGICGSIFGTVSLCYNDGIVEGENNIGGIVGLVGNLAVSTIQNCYNKGEVFALKENSSSIGGVLGHVNLEATSLNITNNYNIGKINVNGSKVTNVGGVIGIIHCTNNTQNNNYYLDTTLTVTGNSYGASRTTEQMKLPTFVSLLNTGLATAAWEIRNGDNNGYPVFIGLK